jgi:hypothetical protein
MNRNDLLPNPFADLPIAAPAPPDQELADVIAAIELELQAFLATPPLFLSDEFRDRIA